MSDKKTNTCYCCGLDKIGDELVDMGKHEVCAVCLKGEGWLEEQIDLENDTFAKLAEIANEENVTMNIVANRMLREFVSTESQKDG